MSDWETADGWEDAEGWETSPSSIAQRETTLGEDFKIPFAEVGNTVDRYFTGLYGALVNQINPDAADRVFKSMDERTQTRREWANPENAKQSTAAKIGGVAATLPMQVATFPLSPAGTGQDLLQNNESLGVAAGGAAIDTLGNVVGAAVPGAVGTKTLTKGLTGAGINAAQDYAVRKGITSITEQEQSKKQFEPTWETAAVAATIGAGIGAAQRGKVKSPSVAKLSVLDDIHARKQAEAQVQQPLFADEQGNVSTNGQFSKLDPEAPEVIALAQQNAARLERQAKGLPDGPIYVDKQGVASPELPKTIDTDPNQVNQLRIQQQMELENVAREAENPKGEQLNLEDPLQLRMDFGWEDAPDVTPSTPGAKAVPTTEAWLKDYEAGEQKYIPQSQRGAIDSEALKELNLLFGLSDERLPKVIRNDATNYTEELHKNLRKLLNEEDKVNTPTTSKAVPWKQRGAIDVGPGPSKEERLAKTLGVPIKDYIPADPDVTTVLNEAKKETDSNLKYTWLQSGGTLTAQKTGSTAVLAASRFFQNASKRAERNIRNFVSGPEELFQSISTTEAVELAEVFKREMFARQTFSVAELAEAGFTPRQIDAYEGMRTMFNEALKQQNAARAALGLKPITEQEAYVASRWQGDWRAPVYDKDGRLVWFVAERSQKAAQRAVDFIEKNLGVEVDRERSKVSYKKGASERADLQDSYLVLLEMLDKNDPRIPAIKSAMEEAMANDAFSALAQSKHFEEKANVRGFIGDQLWKNREKDAYNMLREQFRYAKNAFTWAELQKASKSVSEIVNDADLKKTQPKNLGYIQDYARQNLGYGEAQYVGAAERELARMLGMDRQSAYQAVGTAKNFFLTTKLSMSLGYAASSLLQPVISPVQHSILSNQGFKHNPAKTLFSGISYGLGSYVKSLGKTLGKEVPFKMTPLAERALKYAEDNGIINRNIYDEAAGLGKNKVAEALQNTIGKTVSEPEHLSRSIVFQSFVSHLEQSGVYKNNELAMFQKAEELTNISMADYRRGERPMVFDKLGLVGQGLSTLQTFKFNYLNQLHTVSQMAMEGIKNGDYKKVMPFIYFVGLQQALGGSISIPFMEDVNDLLQQVKKILPHSMYNKVKDFDVKSWMIENMPDWASHGAVSKLTGANMSTRFDASNVGTYSADQAFPFAVDIARQADKLLGFVASPNESTGAEAAYAVTPPGLQGLVETNMDAFKVGKRKEDGTQRYKNPRDVVSQDVKFKRTPSQELYRMYGLRELGESKKTELEFRQNENEQQRKERQKSYSLKFYDAIVRKDKADIVKYAKQYADVGGNPEEFSTIINREIEKGNIPKETLSLIKGSTAPSVQRALRMQNKEND